MKNQELQSSLIKSGIILVLCVFFIYAFAVGDSGGVTGTIGSIFSGALFLLGLTFAVAVSVLVMIGIYFGILYMYNQEVCQKTYDEFKAKVADSSKTLSGACGPKSSSTNEARPAAITAEDLQPLSNNQKQLAEKLSELQSSVSSLGKALNTVSSSVTDVTAEMTNLSEKTVAIEEDLENKAATNAIEDTAKKLSADITALQNTVKPLNDKISEIETMLSSLSSDEENGGDDLQEKLDATVKGLQEEMAGMQKSIDNLASRPKKQAAATEEEHRLLSYFANKKDKKQFIDSVNESVKKEMTYAQAGEFLSETLSTKASEVIAEHPSLTKDYIKICRQKS